MLRFSSLNFGNQEHCFHTVLIETCVRNTLWKTTWQYLESLLSSDQQFHFRKRLVFGLGDQMSSFVCESTRVLPHKVSCLGIHLEEAIKHSQPSTLGFPICIFNQQMIQREILACMGSSLFTFPSTKQRSSFLHSNLRGFNWYFLKV